MSGSNHRHSTDRQDGQIIAECPNFDGPSGEHLAVEADYESADEDAVDRLVSLIEECPACGAELNLIDLREPTEVIE